MHDSLDPRDSAQPTSEPRQATPTDSATDREVPVDGRELPPAVHAFLDGDAVAQSALEGAERELALWKKIAAETGRRRRMATPSHVPAQILSKLSDD